MTTGELQKEEGKWLLMQQDFMGEIPWDLPKLVGVRLPKRSVELIQALVGAAEKVRKNHGGKGSFEWSLPPEDAVMLDQEEGGDRGRICCEIIEEIEDSCADFTHARDLPWDRTWHPEYNYAGIRVEWLGASIGLRVVVAGEDRDQVWGEFIELEAP